MPLPPAGERGADAVVVLRLVERLHEIHRSSETANVRGKSRHQDADIRRAGLFARLRDARDDKCRVAEQDRVAHVEVCGSLRAPRQHERGRSLAGLNVRARPVASHAQVRARDAAIEQNEVGAPPAPYDARFLLEANAAPRVLPAGDHKIEPVCAHVARSSRARVVNVVPRLILSTRNRYKKRHKGPAFADLGVPNRTRLPRVSRSSARAPAPDEGDETEQHAADGSARATRSGGSDLSPASSTCPSCGKSSSLLSP